MSTTMARHYGYIQTTNASNKKPNVEYWHMTEKFEQLQLSEEIETPVTTTTTRLVYMYM